MKKIITITITILFALQLNATPPPIDTLLLLKTRIENNKANFINKKFKVLLDTIKKINLPIVEYSGASDAKCGLYINDTIWVSYFELYFEEFLFSPKVQKKMHFLGPKIANLHK